MKTLIVLLILLFSCSLAFAGDVSLGGFYTPITKTYSATAQASGSIVWSPRSGGRIVLMGMYGSLNANPTTTIDVGTGINATTGLGTFVPIISLVNVTSAPVVVGNGVPIWQGAVDGTLAVNSSRSCQGAVTLWGYER